MSGIQVRVKDMGDHGFVYYDNKRLKSGDVFFIKDEQDFSKRFMEKVDEHPEATVIEKQLTGDPKTKLPGERNRSSSRNKDAARKADALSEEVI